MTEKERVAKELRKKMNWYLARVKLNKLAGNAAYVAAVMVSAPYIMRFYETGHLGAFVVPGLAFFLAKMANWAAEDANNTLAAKRDNMNQRMQRLLASQKTR